MKMPANTTTTAEKNNQQQHVIKSSRDSHFEAVIHSF